MKEGKKIKGREGKSERHLIHVEWVKIHVFAREKAND
jgi:hypothetical protein